MTNNILSYVLIGGTMCFKLLSYDYFIDEKYNLSLLLLSLAVLICIYILKKIDTSYKSTLSPYIFNIIVVFTIFGLIIKDFNILQKGINESLNIYYLIFVIIFYFLYLKIFIVLPKNKK